MKTKFNIVLISIVVILIGIMSSCREKEINNRCLCTDNNGAVVVDTIYHMESDQAYQLCEGKEGSQNNLSCTCSKL